MKELNFDSGLVTYSLNGKCEVTFNPADSNFAERLYHAFDTLYGKQKEMKAKAEKMETPGDIFSFYREQDREMREIIDGVFGQPISDAVFGNVNAYAMADGLPIWANFFLAVMDEMDKNIDKERKATNPRIEKYRKKYHK